MRYLKKCSFVLAIIAAFLMGACSVGVVSAEQNNPLKIWFHNNNGYADTWNLVDSTTGVNYVVVSGELHGDGIGMAICPRYNADGTLYITP